MLQIKSVTKTYGKTCANDNVTLSLSDGQIGILLGPNGAGKSTLIKCVAGLLRFKGEITVNGFGNKTTEAKRLIGYIPEMPAVYDLLTVGEHMEFMKRAYRLTDSTYSDSLLERFELADKKDKLGKELSKGMQQKLSICCALCHRPSVIIFDEPMVGLDPHAIKQLKELFTELRASGASLLISTHMIDSVENYWDITHIMMNGRIAAIKENSAASADGESLEELYFSITEGSSASSVTPSQAESLSPDKANPKE